MVAPVLWHPALKVALLLILPLLVVASILFGVVVVVSDMTGRASS